ncbi:MAG: sulfatase [Planctomycetota bacterium]|jgi:arylsulfatase A-like enzyme
MGSERYRAGLALLAAIPWLSGCSPEARRPNLLLVTVDTLRADALGSYGYDRPTSPRLDAWAARAQRFDAAQATSSWTLPTLATLHTGLLPSSTHTPDFASSLPLGQETLAERLRGAGYETAAIVNHTFLGIRHGLHQGFTHFDDDMVLFVADSHRAVTSDRVTERALDFLERVEAPGALSADRPWFLWVHYFDPHDAYLAHEGFSDPFGIETDRDLYDGEIAWTDHHLGALLEHLERSGLDEETLVCVVADHGEEWEDHGGTGHGLTLFDEVVRVPLLFAGPGVEPGVVETPVSTLDVFPTLLTRLGLEVPSGLGGQALNGQVADERDLVAELDLGPTVDFDALRRGRHKLIVDRNNGEVSLYDLDEDPHEQRDLAALRPELVRELEAALEAELSAAREAGDATRPEFSLDLSSGELEALERLGYGDGDR